MLSHLWRVPKRILLNSYPCAIMRCDLFSGSLDGRHAEKGLATILWTELCLGRQQRLTGKECGRLKPLWNEIWYVYPWRALGISTALLASFLSMMQNTGESYSSATSAFAICEDLTNVRAWLCRWSLKSKYKLPCCFSQCIIWIK